LQIQQKIYNIVYNINMINAESNIKVDNITLINQPSKKRMVRVINEADYQNADTGRLGFVFGLMDISIGPAQNAQIFDLIEEAIGRYYKNQLGYDMAFDDMISFLNHRLVQIVAFKSLKEKCDLVIGVLKDKKILFCVNGQIYSFLLSGQAIKRIYPEDEKTIDVSNKIFPYSLNGEVPKGYTVYFCNMDFNAIVNPYNLGKILKDAPVADVIADIKNYLLKQDTTQYYNVLFISNPPRLEIKEGSRVSLENLFRQEQQTAENISPSLLNFFYQSLKKKTLLSRLIKAVLFVCKKLFSAIEKSAHFILVLLFNLFLVITNIRGQRKERRVVINNQIGGVYFKIANFYNSLTAISKIILSGLVIFGITLIISLGYAAQQQKLKQLRLNYKDKIQLVEKLYNEAEADLLFQDKNTAVKKLKSALTYLNGIPPQIQDFAYKNLLNKVKDNINKIQNISVVSSPVLIADFSSDQSTSLYPPIFLNKDLINILGQDGLVSIDVKNQSIKKNPLSAKNIEKATSYYDNDKKIIYILEGSGGLQTVNPANLTSENKSFSLYKDESAKMFAIYNEKLYTLSSFNKSFSVWKRNPTLSGFGKPISWLSDNLPADSSILSFGIDGNLYVLFSDNQINKYYRGAKTDWSYDKGSIVNDAIKYKKIITDESYRHIYLLGQKTISIISKEGEFLAHLELPALNDLQDATIDESSKTIYVLDSNKKIYTFSYSL